MVALLAALPAQAATLKSAEKYLERAFSVGVVLSDAEVASFGFHDFDPNEAFNLHNDNIGSEDSLELRQQLAVTALPYTFDLPELRFDIHPQLLTRFSIISADNSVKITDHPNKDAQQELILGGMIGYRTRVDYDEHWSITSSLGAHLQYYRNQHQYRSRYSQQFIKPLLDGVVFNTDAYALTLEPSLMLKYQRSQRWGEWNVSSSAHYFYGFGMGEANDGRVGNPEGWYLANGIQVTYPLMEWSSSIQSLYASLRRVDIGGDPSHPLGTNYYYESSLGWLLTPPFHSSWIDNLGIGLSINYGSVIKGGSIVLFFNQAQ